MASSDTALAPNGTGQYCGFIRRFGAWCIDAPLRFAVGLALVFFPMRALVFGEAKRFGSTDARYLWSVMPFEDKAIVYLLWLLAAVIVPWLYTALQESSTPRGTFGKKLLGVQVDDLAGRRISFGRASGRFFARLFPHSALVTLWLCSHAGSRRCTISWPAA
jgi:uncharacterized RDD family membrane protein YckC